jgi:hypothetical protein
MSITKPVIVVPHPQRILCPICGKATYSPGGIHPQCAMQQADEPRLTRLRAARQAEAKIEKPKAITRKKKCPKCDALSDTRREVCQCGFRFRVGRRLH